jgi:hypothetical protein
MSLVTCLERGAVACAMAAALLPLAPTGRQRAAIQPAARTVFPFELYQNAIWFQARVNGSRPLHFLFDTAAGSCVLSRSVADELKLPVLEEFDQPNAGSGDLPTRVSIRPAVTVEFGGVSFPFPQIAALEHEEVSKTYGAAIDGIIGFPLMARYVVEIDFDRRTLALHDPAGFTYAGTGVSLPLEIPADRREPIVRATIRLPGREPLEGRFLVDEPHPHCLLFATPFSRAHDLRTAAEKAAKRLVPASAMGVGGKTPYVVGRLDELVLGPFALKRPTAGFAEAKAGAFAREDIAGIIGGEILRRFRVTLDVPHKRMMLERGKAFDEPFPWDASGLKLRANGPAYRRFEVVEVVPDGPGAEAGVRAGDEIRAINGRAAADLTLWDVQRLFREVGRTYPLELMRSGSSVKVALTTRQLI